ncbi:hypothetical protein T4E_3573 [Trichinella pseudospiralis]|uniref:Uncharacterized protein n=1 Tax=Trichinella pseudospiralis TaxID=6337 RepID=A0A0V0XRG0_TRIPS|nr:hypothetical protein T4E_3573 [Trichinella pseudospiralis]
MERNELRPKELTPLESTACFQWLLLNGSRLQEGQRRPRQCRELGTKKHLGLWNQAHKSIVSGNGYSSVGSTFGCDLKSLQPHFSKNC